MAAVSGARIDVRAPERSPSGTPGPSPTLEFARAGGAPMTAHHLQETHVRADVLADPEEPP